MTTFNLKATTSRAFGRGFSRKKRKSDKDQKVNVFIPPISQNEKLKLRKIARTLVEPGKGILTVDEPLDELGDRLEKNGLDNTQESRLGYVLAVIGDCKVIGPYVSGVALREDVCFQHIDKDKKETLVRRLTCNGIQVGIRVGKGLVPLGGTHDEVTSSGLDNLMSDCTRYQEQGVTFALMTCAFKISDYTPSLLGYVENANIMARFASTSQKAGLVPVISIDVVNSLPDCSVQANYVCERQTITQEILAFVIKALADFNVYIEGILLRLSPVSSHFNITKVEALSVARATLSAIVRTVPPAIGGVLLGDANSLKISNMLLNEVHASLALKPCPITFGWSHVVQEGLMEEWKGLDKHVANVGKTINERLKNCCLASMGQLPKDQFSVFITNDSET